MYTYLSCTLDDARCPSFYDIIASKDYSINDMDRLRWCGGGRLNNVFDAKETNSQMMCEQLEMNQNGLPKHGKRCSICGSRFTAQ